LYFRNNESDLFLERGGERMNKSELIEGLAARKGLSYKKAEEIVNRIFDSMVQAMQQGDRIEIRGFGSFVVKEYKSYTGRNPKTGEPIEVQPKKLPFFKVGKELRERVDAK
jgi:integration host factor subunit beta